MLDDGCLMVDDPNTQCWQAAQDPVGDKRIIKLFWSTSDSAHRTTQHTLQCTRPYLTATTVRPLRRLSVAMMAMTGRVTMLGRARGAGQGDSYRTVQRFFATVIPGAMLLWGFLRHHMYRGDDVSLLGGDEVVVTAAGTHTHGLDRFFARLSGKAVPGPAFFTLSLLHTPTRRSFPVRGEQVIRSDAEKAASKAKAAAKGDAKR
jgi:putative transposase